MCAVVKFSDTAPCLHPIFFHILLEINNLGRLSSTVKLPDTDMCNLPPLPSRPVPLVAQDFGSTGDWRIQGNKQHLGNLRRQGLLPRLRNERAICLLGRLFCLKLCRICSNAGRNGTRKLGDSWTRKRTASH